MRILQLIQKKQLRGAEVFACQLSNELLRKGHTVRMVSLYDGDAQLPFPQVETLHTSFPLGSDFMKMYKLYRIVQNWKPDVIQTNAGDTTRMAVWSKLLFRWKVPVIMRNASTISQYMGSGFKKRIYGFLVRNVAAVASVSEVSKRDFEQLFPDAASKIHLLPIGIDPDDFKEVQPFLSTRPYLLHIGGFTFEKNHRGLLQLIENIRKQIPDIRLLCAGDGPLFSEIQEIIKRKQLEPNVKLLGRRTDIPSLLKGAKLLVLPSIIEGLPGVILEAMYARVPVIAYNAGGIAQIVQPETGWIIEKGDEEAFCTTIVQLWKATPQELQHKTDRAYNMVAEGYTNHQIADRFEVLYQSLIK
jgi:glycosyltransferase involved in cell wall biosynthesis